MFLRRMLKEENKSLPTSNKSTFLLCCLSSIFGDVPIASDSPNHFFPILKMLLLGFLDNHCVKAHLQKQELSNDRCCKNYFDSTASVSGKRNSELYFTRYKTKYLLKSTYRNFTDTFCKF